MQTTILFFNTTQHAGSVLGGLFLAAAVVVGIKDNPDLMKPAVYPLASLVGFPAGVTLLPYLKRQSAYIIVCVSLGTVGATKSEILA